MEMNSTENETMKIHANRYVANQMESNLIALIEFGLLPIRGHRNTYDNKQYLIQLCTCNLADATKCPALRPTLER